MIVAAGAALTLSGAASAQNFVDIDLAGWIADAGYSNAANTSLVINLPTDAQIIDADLIDVTFETFGSSWNNELIFSINDSSSFVDGYWDAYVNGTTSTAGVFGPFSQSHSTADVSFGAPFTTTTGELYIETYTEWAGGAADYHEVLSGTLRVYWVPTPGTIATVGLAGLVAARRRRA